MKMIQRSVIGILLLLVSLFTECIGAVAPSAMILKYLSMAYGSVLLTSGLLGSRTHRHTCSFLYYVGVLILLFFTIMTLDTYLFHGLFWYPGMFRYALFSTYGVLHFVVFVLVGFALVYGHESA